jgi:ABC-type histidine transport system ATPase subunit
VSKCSGCRSEYCDVENRTVAPGVCNGVQLRVEDGDVLIVIGKESSAISVTLPHSALLA